MKKQASAGRIALLKKRYILIVIAILILSFPVIMYLVQQQQYTGQYASTSALYIAPNGNDNNDGSQAHPFATIQRAANLATPGTTVHVAPGTYNQTVNINKNGSANARIVFISDTKWGAKIVTNATGNIWTTNGDYIDIIGFDISGPKANNGIANSGSYMRTIGNYVHDIPSAQCNNIGGTGIDQHGYTDTDNEITGNVIARIGNYPNRCDYTHNVYMSSKRGRILNNISYQSVGNGLYTNHAATGTIIANNISFSNAEYGIGINTVPEQSGGGDNFIVANNIVAGNGLAGMKTWSSVSGANNQYLNNLFFNNPKDHIQDGARNALVKGTIIADPQFVNYKADGSGDYHLKAGSAAIDAGINTNAPATDFDNNPRPQGKGYDIGAYEFASIVTQPSFTSTPTKMPPTVTPTTTPTKTPTPTAFISSSPTPLPPKVTSLSVTVGLHGIGFGGDNVNPQAKGNPSPQHLTRPITITIFDLQNIQKQQTTGTITYNSASGLFKGSIALGSLPTGTYQIKVRTHGFLIKQIPALISITQGQTATLPQVNVVTGDIDNNNQLSIFDYNAILNCFGSKQTTSTCTFSPNQQSPGADIDDTGAVDGLDYNLFLRELSVQSGS